MGLNAGSCTATFLSKHLLILRKQIVTRPVMAEAAEKGKAIDETDQVSQDKDGSQLHKMLMNKAGHKIRERRGRYGAKIENQARDIFDHYQTPLVEEKRAMLEERATEKGKIAKKPSLTESLLSSQTKTTRRMWPKER